MDSGHSRRYHHTDRYRNSERKRVCSGDSNHLEGFKKEGKIQYQLTPMNTLIEGELSDLFEVIQTIHEAPFQKGIHRVATNIRIDDRRDKKTTMEGKLASVQRHFSQ